MTSDRPWRLEVEEADIIDGSATWAVWSTYRTEENALVRLRTLRGKGYTVQVVNTETGEVAGSDDAPECPLCGDHHATPSRGECLL